MGISPVGFFIADRTGNVFRRLPFDSSVDFASMLVRLQ